MNAMKDARELDPIWRHNRNNNVGCSKRKLPHRILHENCITGKYIITHNVCLFSCHKPNISAVDIACQTDGYIFLYFIAEMHAVSDNILYYVAGCRLFL